MLSFVGLGSMGLLAQLTQAAFSRISGVPASRIWKRFAQAAVVVLLPLHLLAAPPLGIMRMKYQDAVSARMQRAIASVPNDPAIASQTLVLVNPPEHIYLVTAIPTVKQLDNLPAPRRIRALSAGSALEITRVGARSLRVRFPTGFFPSVFSRFIRQSERSLFDWAAGRICRGSQSWSRRLMRKAIPSRCCTSSRYRSRILRCAGCAGTTACTSPGARPRSDRQ